jgi:hypothetical protein
VPAAAGKYNRLVEMLLQRPQLIKHPQELEDGYIWQRLIMVRVRLILLLLRVASGC